MTGRTFSLRATARILEVGEQTLRQHMVDGGTAIEINGGRDRLRLVRIGRRCLVPAAELARILGEDFLSKTNNSELTEGEK